MSNGADAAGVAEWIYLKLYLGQAYDKFDGLILEVVPKILLLEQFERWFFLRYLDEKGVHLRLRFQVRAGNSARLAEPIRSICEKGLEEVVRLPPADYRPMVLPPGYDAQRNPSTAATVGIVIDAYEPELEKFGGARGMPIAEEIFEASSRIAVAILRDEREAQYSRKTIAPCLMSVIHDAFAPSEGAPRFWRKYSFYWLGGETMAAEDWRTRFFEKGMRLREDGIPVIWPADLSPRATQLTEDWRQELQRAAKAYARIEDLGEVTTDILAFNFTHLMNNRLGLISMEEAYLAALLEQRADGDKAA
jgi:thiopeptide-type bacteriocin biosynthesis protein